MPKVYPRFGIAQRSVVTCAALVGALALLAAGCAPGHPKAARSVGEAARHSSSAPVATTIPAWCTTAFAAAANGKAAVRLLPYVKDNPYIKDLYQRWVFALEENNLLLSQPRKWSVEDLLNNAPVTTNGLYPDAVNDMRHLNRICNGA